MILYDKKYLENFMRGLLDTNIIIDFLTKREPFAKESKT